MPETTTESEKAKKGDAKVHATMHEFKHGALHSGTGRPGKKGPKVTDRRQAIAIALSQAGRSNKAANYGAHVGQAIAGNLFRGTGGQFTAGGGASPAPAPATATKPDKAATADRQRQQRQALADQQRQERQGVRDQAKTDAQKKVVENVGNLAEKLLSSDMAEVLTVGDPIGNINGVEPQYGDKLVSQGLAVKYKDGTYDLSGTGRSMVNAMAKGNERQAKIAIMRAQALADRKAATAARRGKRGRVKKEWLALAIKAAGSFSAYKNYARKDFVSLDVAEPVHTGVMLAFYLPPEIAQALAIPGGEKPEDLHLTLAFLGDSTELEPATQGAIQDAIEQFCAQATPIGGEISGVGLFIGGDGDGDSDPFYASFDAPALVQFRSVLLNCLSQRGVSVAMSHGFTPHITLAYLPKGAALPQIKLPKLPVTLQVLSFCWGDTRLDYDLVSRVLMPGEAVKQQIALKELDANPFTAYKDMTGRWRWIVRSSSAFEDRDQETVSLKALEGATRKMDARGKYGILDWWHTPAALGTCDFSAMHGLMLVESGNFKSEALGERISAAIANKEFDPAVSLMFAHNEPGPQVVPGRVFDDIEIIQRSLLPAERASNIATTVQIINLADKAQATKKEVNLKMDALKEEKLKTLIGPELFEAFMSGTELAEKSLMTAGFSWKAIAPPPPLVVDDPTKKKIDTKAAPGAATAPNGMVEGSPEEEALETPEEEAAEPPDPGEDTGGGGDADQIIQGLYDEVDAIIGRRMQSTADEIVAKLSSIKAVSSKETEDALGVLTIALKENTSALSTVIAENKSLKERLDLLEGKLPPAVAGRITQGKGQGQQVVTDPQIIAALKEQNKPTIASNDPFKVMYDLWTAQGIDPQQPVAPQG